MERIGSWEKMHQAIHECGLIPFFRCSVPGWSIQEMTAPGSWFAGDGAEDGVLGPWDWKVDVVRQGDIAYGKFLGCKAAFATAEWYAHLMNWRRSLPRYRMAEGERFKAVTVSDRLAKALAPAALCAIREAGALGNRELRSICTSAVTPGLLRALGAKYKPLLTPSIKKNIMESVMLYLQMGTWSVVGDIQRVYNGPSLTYKGWQISSNTTPEAMFGSLETEAVDIPSWAARFESETASDPLQVDCSPEESRSLIIRHVMELFPDADPKVLEKMI